VSQENVEIVRRIYEVLNSERSLPPELFALDCMTDLRDASPGGDVLHGIDAMQQALGAYFETFDDFHVAAEVLGADDCHVITAIRDGGRIKGSSAEIWSNYFHIWTLRDGKVARLSSHTERATAFKAVGLEE